MLSLLDVNRAPSRNTRGPYNPRLDGPRPYRSPSVWVEGADFTFSQNIVDMHGRLSAGYVKNGPVSNIAKLRGASILRLSRQCHSIVTQGTSLVFDCFHPSPARIYAPASSASRNLIRGIGISA